MSTSYLTLTHVVLDLRVFKTRCSFSPFGVMSHANIPGECMDTRCFPNSVSLRRHCRDRQHETMRLRLHPHGALSAGWRSVHGAPHKSQCHCLTCKREPIHILLKKSTCITYIPVLYPWNSDMECCV